MQMCVCSCTWSGEKFLNNTLDVHDTDYHINIKWLLRESLIVIYSVSGRIDVMLFYI